MAHLIPRVMSWAVSGTPIKRHVDDLYSLLQFLKQGPIAFDKRVQKLLKKRHFRPTFVSCFQSVMHRYAKQEVAHELTLPPQYRMVYGIHFTDVERTNYMDKWEQCLAECNFNIADDTSTEADGLQSWLIRLRQTWYGLLNGSMDFGLLYHPIIFYLRSFHSFVAAIPKLDHGIWRHLAGQT